MADEDGVRTRCAYGRGEGVRKQKRLLGRSETARGPGKHKLSLRRKIQQLNKGRGNAKDTPKEKSLSPQQMSEKKLSTKRAQGECQKNREKGWLGRRKAGRGNCLGKEIKLGAKKARGCSPKGDRGWGEFGKLEESGGKRGEGQKAVITKQREGAHKKTGRPKALG